jgi:tRNA(adenine34) deaminase
MTDAGTDDLAWMRRALDLARRAEAMPGANPIGCVIVRDGKVLAEGHNEVGLRCDPTAHAEIVTIRRACERAGDPELRGATLYSTLQPCGMCSMASIWTKIGRIVYGAGRDDVHKMYFEDRHLDAFDFIRDAFRDDLTIEGGVLAAECATLYVGPDEDVPKDEQVNR